MLRILAQRQFPVETLRVFASDRSVGKEVAYNGQTLKLEHLEETSFKDVHLAMFAAGADISVMYGPIAAAAAALLVHNTSAWPDKGHQTLPGPVVQPNHTRRQH